MTLALVLCFFGYATNARRLPSLDNIRCFRLKRSRVVTEMPSVMILGRLQKHRCRLTTVHVALKKRAYIILNMRCVI